MSEKNKRAVVNVPPEWDEEINSVKNEIFQDATQAEMYRQLIRLGLNSTKEKEFDKSFSEFLRV
jgi:hypothetical protein